MAAEVKVLQSALTQQGGYDGFKQAQHGHSSSLKTIAFFLGSILSLGGIWSMMRSLAHKRPVVQPSLAVAGIPESHNLASSMSAVPVPALGSSTPRRSTL